MKTTIIVLSSILLFPSIVQGGFCLSGESYKIINYNNLPIENTIKRGGLYDIFLSGPYFKSENIVWIGSHYINNPFCKYSNFDNLKELGYNNLSKEDKLILI